MRYDGEPGNGSSCPGRFFAEYWSYVGKKVHFVKRGGKEECVDGRVAVRKAGAAGGASGEKLRENGGQGPAEAEAERRGSFAGAWHGGLGWAICGRTMERARRQRLLQAMPAAGRGSRGMAERRKLRSCARFSAWKGASRQQGPPGDVPGVLEHAAGSGSGKRNSGAGKTAQQVPASVVAERRCSRPFSAVKRHAPETAPGRATRRSGVPGAAARHPFRRLISGNGRK